MPAKRKPAKTKKTTLKKSGKSKQSTSIAKISKPQKPYSHNQLIATLAEQAGTTKQMTRQMLDTLVTIIEAHLTKGGPGTFKFLGLLKMVIKTKPATKARKGTNPFTGEEMAYKAKPASKVVRIRPLKKLKAIV